MFSMNSRVFPARRKFRLKGRTALSLIAPAHRAGPARRGMLPTEKWNPPAARASRRRRGRRDLIDGATSSGRRVFDPAGDPQPAHPDVAENQQAVRHGQRLAAHRAVGDVAAALAQQFHQAQRAVAAHGVEGERGVRSAEHVLGGGEAALVVDENVVRTESREVHRSPPAGGRRKSCGCRDPARVGSRSGRRRNCRRFCTIQSPFSSVPKPCSKRQAVAGFTLSIAAWSGSMPGGSLKSDARNRGVGGPSRGAAQENHAVARLEIRGIARFHDAAALDAGRGGQRGFHAVGALDGIEVRRIDRRGENADQHLAGVRRLRNERRPFEFKHLSGAARIA